MPSGGTICQLRLYLTLMWPKRITPPPLDFAPPCSPPPSRGPAPRFPTPPNLAGWPANHAGWLPHSAINSSRQHRPIHTSAPGLSTRLARAVQERWTVAAALRCCHSCCWWPWRRRPTASAPLKVGGRVGDEEQRGCWGEGGQGDRGRPRRCPVLSTHARLDSSPVDKTAPHTPYTPADRHLIDG